MRNFPKKIYVARERNGPSPSDGTYLTVVEDAFEGEDETRTVAVYQLVEIGEVKVERSYRRKGAR